MSLNLNPTPTRPSSSYHTSPTYTEAVNDAQLVRTFSIVALIGSVLIFIGGAVAIGVGVAVIGLGGTLLSCVGHLCDRLIGAQLYLRPVQNHRLSRDGRRHSVEGD
jgi:hypothetical protein